MKNETINGVDYKVKSEVKLTGLASKGNYESQLVLLSPNGKNQFWALRSKKGTIEVFVKV